MKQAQLRKIAGEKWKTLDPLEKERYKAMRKKMIEQYIQTTQHLNTIEQEKYQENHRQLELKLDMTNSNLKECTDQLEAAKEREEMWTEKMTSCEDQLSKTNHEADQAQHQSAKLNGVISGQEEQLELLKKNILAMERQHQQELNNSDERVITIRDVLEGVQETKLVAENELSKTRNELTLALEDLGLIKENMKSYEDELSVTKHALDQAQRRSGKLNEVISGQEEQMELLKKNILAMDRQHRQELTNTDERLIMIREELERVQENNIVAEDELSKTQNELRQTHQDFGLIEEENSELRGHLDVARIEIEKLENLMKEEHKKNNEKSNFEKLFGKMWKKRD